MKSKNSTDNYLIGVSKTSIEWMAWESIGREITPTEFHRFLSTLDDVNDQLFKILDKKIVACTDNSKGQWGEVDKAFKKYHQEKK